MAAAFLLPAGVALVAFAVALALNFRGVADWVVRFNISGGHTSRDPRKFKGFVIETRTIGALITLVIGVGFVVAGVQRLG